MTDSPAVRAPLDPREEPILGRLLDLRDQLSLLKQDRSTYIKSQDVVHIYEQVIEQVHLLNTIREEHGKPLEVNRVDNVLEDCFQLISLFFLTVGRNNEAPAVYSMASTIKRLVDHLKEASFFSAKDIDSMGHTLDQMEETVRRGKDTYSPHLLTLLSNSITTCRIGVADLQANLVNLSPSLAATYEKLVSILRSMAACNTRAKFPTGEVENFRAELKRMQATLVNGKFPGEDPNNQDVVINLLNRCLFIADLVLEKKGKIDERFKGPYDRLLEIRNALEKLSITHSWSLRETDLYNFQRKLDRFDESRIDGNFQDETGYTADLHTQRTLLYLLRRSYAYIYELMAASEPVSEALLPIYNQLQTLRRCLVEVKRSGGVSSSRELYPYSMKLSSIDNMRVDGRFMVGQDIPEGQGGVSALLAECFDMLYDLKVEADEADEEQPNGGVMNGAK